MVSGSRPHPPGTQIAGTRGVPDDHSTRDVAQHIEHSGPSSAARSTGTNESPAGLALPAAAGSSPANSTKLGIRSTGSTSAPQRVGPLLRGAACPQRHVRADVCILLLLRERDKPAGRPIVDERVVGEGKGRRKREKGHFLLRFELSAPLFDEVCSCLMQLILARVDSFKWSKRRCVFRRRRQHLRTYEEDDLGVAEGRIGIYRILLGILLGVALRPPPASTRCVLAGGRRHLLRPRTRANHLRRPAHHEAACTLQHSAAQDGTARHMMTRGIAASHSSHSLPSARRGPSTAQHRMAQHSIAKQPPVSGKATVLSLRAVTPLKLILHTLLLDGGRTTAVVHSITCGA